MNLKIFCCIIISIVSLSAKSQTCCSGGIPLSNNIGLANLGKGTSQIGIHYNYNHLNTLNNGTEKLDDDSRLRETHSILLNINYSISDRFSLEALFTWVNQRREISQFGNINLDQTSGVGDGVFLATYSFPNLFSENSNFRLGIGSKIPLGSSEEKSNQGIVFNADLQPGSNAWDIIYWTSLSKSFNFRPSFNLSSRIIYRETGVNNSYFRDSSYKFGNEIQAFLNISDQFLIFKIIASPSVSVKFRKAVKDQIGGFNLDNTGGNWLSIIPNFSINLNSNLLFSTKAELPLYSDVDGTQLTPTYRITAGFLFRIPVKKQVLILN